MKFAIVTLAVTLAAAQPPASKGSGTLTIDGDPVGRRLGRFYLREHAQDAGEPSTADGSIMIVLATDAPLSDRNLARLARRSFAGASLSCFATASAVAPVRRLAVRGLALALAAADGLDDLNAVARLQTMGLKGAAWHDLGRGAPGSCAAS